MHLDRDFSEFVECFTAHEVRFLIVGGYALAAHGVPRATGDFDAWIWVGGNNAERVLLAIHDFGFGSVGLTTADFDHDDSIVQLGYPPLRIDVLTSIDGVRFDDAWNRRLVVDVDGKQIPFIGLTDLITNKKSTGRAKDAADVMVLERRRSHDPRP